MSFRMFSRKEKIVKIEVLDTYCKVVEEGSISEVAKRKYISQPAITRQIRQLEEAYNTLLFNRDKGKLIVTKEGKELYNLFKEIVYKYKLSFERLENLKDEREHHLSIGSSFTIGEYVLPNLLGKFKYYNPTVEINLIVNSTPKIIKKLEGDEIGLALVEGEVKNSNLIARKFLEDELVVICSIHHEKWGGIDKIDLEELLNEKLIWREKKSSTRKWLEKRLFQHKKLDKCNIYMELGSNQAIKNAVEHNLGVAIMSNLAVEHELESSMLKKLRIRNLNLKRSLWVVKKKRSFYRKIEQNFLQFLMDQKLKVHL